MLLYLILALASAALFLVLLRGVTRFSQSVWKRVLLGGALGAMLLLSLRVNMLAPLLVGILQWALLQWLNRFTTNSQTTKPPADSENLSRKEAADLLGVSVDADRQTIEAAYRRLQQKNHPDMGGSNGLSALLSRAREKLLDE